MTYIGTAIALVLRSLIIVYRYALSPVLGANCRYEPSCSAYAEQAIASHGPFSGSWLAIKRIFRCHPWGDSGFDPVPERRSCNHDRGRAHAAPLAKLPEG